MTIAAKTLTRILVDLDIAVPADLERVNATITAVHTAAADDTLDQLSADLLAGTMKPKDVAKRVAATASAMVAREKAGEIAANLEPVLERLTRRAAIANGDKLITAARPVVEQASQQIVDATLLFGTTPHEPAVLNMGPAAAVAWGERHQAIATIKRARKLLTTLHALGYGKTPAVFPDAAWWLPAVDTADQWQHALDAWHNTGEGAANLAVHGIAVTLNTAAEARTIADHAAQLTEAARIAEARNDPAVQMHNRRVEASRIR